VQQPRQRDLRRGHLQPAGRGDDDRVGQDGVVGVEGRAQREEGHERHAVVPTGFEHVRVGGVDQVVRVLHAHHLDPGSGDTVLVQIDVAQADGPDEALPAHGLHGVELLGERHVRLRVATEVHHRDLVQGEGVQVGLDPGPQLLRGLRRHPPTRVVPGRTDLGHDDQPVRIGVECLAEEGVGHVRPVELRSIDVVHPELDGLSHHLEGHVVVLRRPEHSRPGQLHGPEAHATHIVPARYTRDPREHTRSVTRPGGTAPPYRDSGSVGS
jgi:hypothetical protein